MTYTSTVEGGTLDATTIITNDLPDTLDTDQGEHYSIVVDGGNDPVRNLDGHYQYRYSHSSGGGTVEPATTAEAP